MDAVRRRRCIQHCDVHMYCAAQSSTTADKVRGYRFQPVKHALENTKYENRKRTFVSDTLARRSIAVSTLGWGVLRQWMPLAGASAFGIVTCADIVLLDRVPPPTKYVAIVACTCIVLPDRVPPPTKYVYLAFAFKWEFENIL